MIGSPAAVERTRRSLDHPWLKKGGNARQKAKNKLVSVDRIFIKECPECVSMPFVVDKQDRRTSSVYAHNFPLHRFFTQIS